MSEEPNWKSILKSDVLVDAQVVSDFEHFRRTERSKLTLLQQPVLTVQKFFQGAVYAIITSIKYCLSHKMFLFLIIPVFFLWLILDNIPGVYSQSVNDFEFWVQYIVWWVGLGILSSVGLGSGLQSGVLFLFPHIFKVCLAARTCNSLDFDSASDMWFRQPENLFQCPAVISETAAPVTFMGVWAKIILPCFLQSAGTAIGEIPPYWMARSARIAAMEAEHLHLFSDEDPDALPEELEATSKYSIVNYLKEQMILFLHKYGFYGVLLMASYPNLAFDLCGVCCGHFLMPFSTFFMATFLGKAIVRNSYQSFFYVLLCSEEYLEIIIRLLQHLLPDSWELDHVIRDILEQGRESFQRKLHESQQQHQQQPNVTDPDSLLASSSTILPNDASQQHPHNSALSEQLMILWNIFMTLVLTTFFLSCLAEFAQCYQRVLDDKDAQILRQRVPPHIVEQIASPNSGRWHLPAPTPLKTLRKVRKSLSPLPALPPLSTPKRLRTPVVSFASGVKSPAGTSSQKFRFQSNYSDSNLASQQSTTATATANASHHSNTPSYENQSPVPNLRLPSSYSANNIHDVQDTNETPKTNKVLFASPTAAGKPPQDIPSPTLGALRQRQGFNLHETSSAKQT